MKDSKALFITFYFALWLFSSLVYGQSRKTETLKQYLKFLQQEKGFQGEILIAKDTQILYQDAIGLASRELGIPIKPNQKYRIASITKTFTGTLLVLAQREKKLKLNDRVRQYLPELSSKFKHITLHQLLTHTSGIPHYEGIQDYWIKKSRHLSKPGEIMTEINQLKLCFTPGSKMKYTSLGYYLLATVLEKVYEVKLSTLLKKKILNPLNMHNSGIGHTLAVVPNLVNGYHQLPNNQIVKAPYRNYALLKGSGDMYASANDLLRWNLSFLHNKLFTSREQQLIFEHQNYGYGWFIDQNKTQSQRYYHGGGTWGYSTFNAFYPEEKISIIILSNLSTLPMKEIGYTLERIILDESFKLPLKLKQGYNQFELHFYRGTYVSVSGKMTLYITVKNAGLYAQVAGNPAFQVYPQGAHRFFGKKITISFAFKLENQQVVGLTAQRMGKKFHFKKQ